MTQSYPTNFHTFLTRKVLAAAESIADWIEVTAAEKARLEAQDAAWQRPPQSFIDLWNEACGSYGRYNETTGYFELNGIIDISYEEALKIYEVGAPETSYMVCRYANAKIRTNLPPMFDKKSLTTYVAVTSRMVDMSSIEVLNIGNIAWDSEISAGLNFVENNVAGMDDKNHPLRKIIGEINAYYTLKPAYGGWKIFNSTIEEFTLTNLQIDLNLSNCPKITFETFQTIVSRAINATPITITVHPEVYTKLTEGEEEWQALNELALSKQITFAIS